MAVQLKAMRSMSDDPDVYENVAYQEEEPQRVAGNGTVDGAAEANVRHRDNVSAPRAKAIGVEVTVEHEETEWVEHEYEPVTFDDIEPESNRCTDGVRFILDGTNKLYQNHFKIIWIIIWAIVACLYAAYFGYAMYYSFGDEASIRLLWVTCVVVFCLLVNLFWNLLEDSIKTCMEPCMVKVRKHGEMISWVVLGIIYLFVVIFVIVDVAVVSKNPYNLVSGCGIIVYVILLYLFSHSPAMVRWRPVLWGLALQFVFALAILRWSAGYSAFVWLGKRVAEFLLHADTGSKFLFGDAYIMHFFAFKILPVVVFFSTFISILYYLGVMQAAIKKVAWVMQTAMDTTAGESMNAAGNIFIGQTEAPLMIRPLIQEMTRSELHAVMTGGFATIAGTVLAAYILFGVPANHLLSASVMSAPAALAMSKLIYPETQKSRTKAEDVQKMEKKQRDQYNCCRLGWRLRVHQFGGQHCCQSHRFSVSSRIPQCNVDLVWATGGPGETHLPVHLLLCLMAACGCDGSIPPRLPPGGATDWRQDLPE